MEIHKIKTFRIIIHLLCFIFLFSSICYSNSVDSKINVVVTNSILSDMVKNVGGEEIFITTIVGPDQEMHNYIPKPLDIKKIINSDIVFANGLNFDNWVNRIKEKVNIIYLSDGLNYIEKNGEKDPHGWNSPFNAPVYVENIVSALCKIKQEKCSLFKNNAAIYIGKISKIAQKYKMLFDKLPSNNKTLLTSHDAFEYLSRDFNLRFIAINSINEDNEVTAKQLVQILETIKKEKIKAIFLENSSNSKFTEQVASESGINIGGTLFSDSLSRSEKGNTYLKLITYNLDTIYQNLK